MQYRNSQKRYYDERYPIYFIVAKTQNNFPYFKEPIFCDLFIEELRLCKDLKKFKLYAFSLIYDHLNLLIQPSEEFNISKVMKSLKENVSRDINYIMKNLDGLRNRFTNKYNSIQYLFPKFKWQKSFHDHIIRNDKDFFNHYNYTAYNHLKHRLPEDWNILR